MSGDVVDAVARWVDEGHPVALGRVVAVAGSAPRGPGAAMAVDDRHRVVGSVSGGCVESALVDEADRALATGRVGLVSFDADDDGFSVGLTCGGRIDVVVEPVAAWPAGVLDALAAGLASGRALALATVATPGAVPAALLVRADGSTVGTLGSEALDRRIAASAGALVADGVEAARTLGPGEVVARRRSGACDGPAQGSKRQAPPGPSAVDDGGVAAPASDEPTVLVQTWARPARLVVFGAVDFTASLVQVAKVLGFHVTVCDARAVFATHERFPGADEVVVDRPERLLAELGPDLGPDDAVCVLTHDVKFDVPAIVGALATEVGYVGAMGSRRTHHERLGRLREAGVDDAGLERLHSPIGLDLGARSPGETALSILAEVVAARSGGSDAVSSLRRSDRPIHR